MMHCRKGIWNFTLLKILTPSSLRHCSQTENTALFSLSSGFSNWIPLSLCFSYACMDLLLALKSKITHLRLSEDSWLWECETVVAGWWAGSLSRVYSAFCPQSAGKPPALCHPKLDRVMQKRDGLKCVEFLPHSEPFSHRDKHPDYITNRLQSKSGICISFCAPPLKISLTFICQPCLPEPPHTPLIAGWFTQHTRQAHSSVFWLKPPTLQPTATVQQQHLWARTNSFTDLFPLKHMKNSHKLFFFFCFLKQTHKYCVCQI